MFNFQIRKITLLYLVLIASKDPFLVKARTAAVEKRSPCCNSCKTNCNESPCCITNCNECTSSCESTNCENCPKSCPNVQCPQEPCCKNSNCKTTCNSCTPAPQKQVEKEEDKQIVTEEFTIEQPENIDVKINNTNTNLVNLTTHLNINNIVNNYNNISVPIYVNNTNVNNIDFSNVESNNESSPIIVNNFQNNSSQKQVDFLPYSYVYTLPTQPPVQQNCCYIMHPKQCFAYENGRVKCYQKRHRECSSRCNSNVVVIDQNQDVKPNCQYINNWPYVYCGQYERQGKSLFTLPNYYFFLLTKKLTLYIDKFNFCITR